MSWPTSQKKLYAWHENALLGHFAEDLPIEDAPQCGWYKRRLVKAGFFVPARIWMLQPVDDCSGHLVGDEVLQCEVMGRAADPEMQWQWLLQNPITEANFNYLMANMAWAVQHAPHEPMANARQAVDWLKVPTPNFEQGSPT